MQYSNISDMVELLNESIKATEIECCVFNYRISRLYFCIAYCHQLITNLVRSGSSGSSSSKLAEQLEGVQVTVVSALGRQRVSLTSLLQELNDIIKLTARTATRVTAKKSFTDAVLKRKRVLAEFHKIEEHIAALLATITDASASLPFDNSSGSAGGSNRRGSARASFSRSSISGSSRRSITSADAPAGSIVNEISSGTHTHRRSSFTRDSISGATAAAEAAEAAAAAAAAVRAPSDIASWRHTTAVILKQLTAYDAAIDCFDLLATRDMLLGMREVIDHVSVNGLIDANTRKRIELPQYALWRENYASLVALVDFCNKQLCRRMVHLPLSHLGEVVLDSLKWLNSAKVSQGAASGSNSSSSGSGAGDEPAVAEDEYWLSTEEQQVALNARSVAAAAAAGSATAAVGGAASGAEAAASYKSSSIFSFFDYSDTAAGANNRSSTDGRTYTQSAGFGACYTGVWRGAFVCVKRVDFSAFSGGLRGLREALNLTHANAASVRQSRFLSAVLGAAVDEQQHQVLLFSELAPQRSLFDVLTNPQINPRCRLQLSAPAKASLLLDVCAAVQHLHEQCGIVHGRIKDSNVLLFEGYRAKLCDFGWSGFLTPQSRRQDKGTYGIRWTAPEVLAAEAAAATAVGQQQSVRSSSYLFYSGSSAEEQQQQQLNMETFNVLHASSHSVIAGGGTGSEKVSAAATAAAAEWPLQSLTAQSLLSTNASLAGSTVGSFTTAADVYGVGLLAVVLLTELPPFANVPLDSNVRSLLLQQGPPALPSSSSIKDASLLTVLERIATPCLRRQHWQRPAAAEVYRVAEEVYCQIHWDAQSKELQQRTQQMLQVRSEIEELSAQIKRQVDLIAKGKELLAKKDVSDPLMCTGAANFCALLT